jgi:hypothetical protein
LAFVEGAAIADRVIEGSFQQLTERERREPFRLAKKAVETAEKESP